MKRELYLNTVSLDEAAKKWFGRLKTESLFKPLGKETIKVIDSQGRITASPVYAKLSAPFYHASAMDGYAVKFSETFGASERSQKKLKIKEQAVYVDTGDPIPDGFNSVIMIEDINVFKDGKGEYIEISAPVTPWQNVRVIGEDIVATELILPENQKIRPFDIGAMLAGGHTEVSVRKKPDVAVIPTGTEIVEPGTNLKKGDIIEYNSRMLGGFINEWGGNAIRFNIVPDNLDELKKTILEACKKSDMVVVNAGASAGSEDFTSRAISEIGEVILHGVNIKPGKPLMLGWVNNKPVLGIPGYSVSAFLALNLFGKPVIKKWLGLDSEISETLKAKLSRQIASSLGQEEFLRVKVGKVGDNFIATPLARGAGVIMSLVRADGIMRIPSMSEGLGSGSEVDVELFRTKKEIENTLVCIGSHDITLDLLGNILRKRYSNLSLSSAHVGSMGGLMALKRGECHLAGTHLLDEATGEYNLPFIKRLLSGKKIFLVNLVHRDQGLVVPKGNPKKIKGFKDLLRKDIIFMNRQAGSGTRLLTDKNLNELGIRADDVNGYKVEEYTHMGVASAVLTNMADAGLAIFAAAKALDLDFIPIAKERYDLAIPAEFYEGGLIQSILKIIREDDEFRSSVRNLGGYDISGMGEIIYQD
ncbi:MAG: molybdopterin biosynthesis protein [Nitrospiraceae bacterium]|nr:molybdopterin biosynthesis protein [Nitrospiraceae bacterium]